ncbi:hypothetical protein JCM10207_008901 [Rhodosporidiobolus poonsookiae]
MAKYNMSREGYRFDQRSGLETGFATEGAIRPAQYRSHQAGQRFDTIVIGAGYTGLVAARDLTNAGQNVLLVEARDRIGGRTWTAQHEGVAYEMGGTWIHHTQGFTWTELCRYGLDKELIISPNTDYPEHYKMTVSVDNERWVMQPEQLDAVLDAALIKFCDVDGLQGHGLLTIPAHVTSGPFVKPTLSAKYDRMNCQERLDEVKAAGLLSDFEIKLLAPWMSRKCGARLDRCSFLEMLRWALNGNGISSYLGTMTGKFKLRDGQSRFAKVIFDDAFSTENLSYVFDAPVSKIVDRNDGVEVFTSKGSFKGAKVLVTTPINVTNKIEFDPPVPRLRKEACEIGHINHGFKIHSVFNKPDFRSGYWSAYGFKERVHLMSAQGDQVINNGKSSVVVAFGADNADEAMLPSKDPSRIQKWMGVMDPALGETYQGSVWHEWVSDPLSMGTWCMYGPGFYTKYHEGLQKAHGNVEWASSDFAAAGWKGFIDGAIAEGMRSAQGLIKEWRQTKKSKSSRL